MSTPTDQFGALYENLYTNFDDSDIEAELLGDDDHFGAYGTDEIDSELDALDAEIGEAEEFGYDGYNHGMSYGADTAVILIGDATVNVPKAKNAFIYPELLKDAAELFPDWMIQQNLPVAGSMANLENEFLNLAQELKDAVAFEGFPIISQPKGKALGIEFVKAFTYSSILPSLDDSEAYNAMVELYNDAGGKGGELDDKLKRVRDGAWHVAAELIFKDLPTYVAAFTSVFSTGNEVINNYAAYLCLLDIAGVNAFEVIYDSLISQGAIIIKARPAAQTAAQPYVPSVASYDNEHIAPKEGGYLSKIKPVHVVGVGYFLGVGVPILKALF